ncbi:hypothetical protein G7046_g8840 [Stylonectria norvegica]|nr:hypothetical protein G7046_g8840 [Stylonectria norvegica]
MNNEQFRRLIVAKSAETPDGKSGASHAGGTPAAARSLGSRQRSSIPMTPRSLGGAQADFARQLAEQNNATRPQRKFRSFAPKGAKLGSGYVDRAKEREDEAEDERAERLKALEESLKEEEIDQDTFERLRFEIAGGDLSSTHLVKGLDFKLLERIKRGDDIYEEKQQEPEEEAAPDEAADDEFDNLEEQEVQAVTKEKSEKKKGQLSTISLAPGKKRTRDQILAELKASREAAKAKENLLGDRFKKVGAKQMPGSRIERDSKGREVLIIVDEDGHEKRKVRRINPGEKKEDEAIRSGLLMPDKDAKPLGMEVPEQYQKKEEPEEEEEDVDIFDGVGDDYDPLAGMAASDSDSGDEVEAKDDAAVSEEKEEVKIPDRSMPPPPRPQAPTIARNYFKDAKTGLVSEEATKTPSMSDPAILAAIKKAAALNPLNRDKNTTDDEEEDDDPAKTRAMKERQRKLLEMADRDDQDIDMGFGTSRFEDEEDLDDSRVKLSVWGGADGAEGKDGGGPAKRKRGGKKRKGDVNSAADVLRVMEEQKKDKSKRKS